MDTTADAASASLFASLHETAWHHIASYAAPPDVYNLCLSSVHFFHEVAISSSADAEKKQCNVRRSKRKLAAATSSSSNEKKNLFATNLLRTSLLSSLGHVLEQINCGITLEAVLKMGALPEGTALIAGSSMVAACLGKYDWKGDVDVYCSAEGAPLVRSVRKYLYNSCHYSHFMIMALLTTHSLLHFFAVACRRCRQHVCRSKRWLYQFRGHSPRPYYFDQNSSC